MQLRALFSKFMQIRSYEYFDPRFRLSTSILAMTQIFTLLVLTMLILYDEKFENLLRIWPWKIARYEILHAQSFFTVKSFSLELVKSFGLELISFLCLKDENIM